MREVGIEPPPPTDSEKQEIQAIIKEFYTLRKRIGRTGVIALDPIVHVDSKNDWTIESMKNGK